MIKAKILIKKVGLTLFLLVGISFTLGTLGYRKKELSFSETVIPENGVGVHENRITYADGYYYYASQLDHYYIYKVKEDGSDAQCLAKLHGGNFYVEDAYLYFTNYSDHGGIYRMGTDGTGMEKLCDHGEDMQVLGDYLYFRDDYREKYDKCGFAETEEDTYGHDFLYRMRKDGTDRELIFGDVSQYMTVAGRTDAEQGTEGILLIPQWGEEGASVYRYTPLGGNKEEIARFDFNGEIAVYGEFIFCFEGHVNREGKLCRYHLRTKEMTTWQIPPCLDICINKGYLYLLRDERDETEEELEKITLERMKIQEDQFETIYERYFHGKGTGMQADLYAAGENVFLRQFISTKLGCEWFRVSQEGKVYAWEDIANLPSPMPARMVEYGELGSAIFTLKSTKNAQAYMVESLTYQEFYGKDERGMESNPYSVNLPQFAKGIGEFEKINQYFQSNFRDAVAEKDTFFQKVKEGEGEHSVSWYQNVDFNYIYIGRRYVTVGRYESGYLGGNRDWVSPDPVSFDWKSGEVVSLEELFGVPLEEAVAQVTASIYKYMECVGSTSFFFRDYDILTEKYQVNQFFLCKEGIGLYYERFAIDSGAAGDYLFILPWESVELNS